MASFNPHTATAQAPRVATEAGVAHEGRSSHSGSPLLSIVVPTRHEEANVVALVAALEHILADVTMEIIVVDDSDDATPEAVLAVSRTSTRDVRLLHRVDGERKGGLGGAVVAGIRVARGSWVCVMDGDLQHPPEAVARLLARAQTTNAQIVVASRFCADGDVGAFGRGRRMLSNACAAAAHIMFPRCLRDVTDPMSGFFLVRRDALDLDKLKPRGFKILLEILVQTPGLRRAEVPFVFGERHARREQGRHPRRPAVSGPAVGPAVVPRGTADSGSSDSWAPRDSSSTWSPSQRSRRSPGCTTSWRPCSRRSCPPPPTTRSRTAGSSGTEPAAMALSSGS